MNYLKIRTLKPQGTSGTKIFGGYIFEEYLSQLTGQQRAFVMDKMRRQDPACGQLINIMSNTFSSLTYEIKIKEAFMDIPEAVKQRELISTILFDNMHRSFDEIIKDILTQNIYGYSLFEGLWKNEITEAFGAITVLKDLLWRSPKTIWEFHLGDDEQLDYVVQRAYGDKQKDDVKLPASNTFIFTLEKEGRDFEGISPLRRVYGPWQIKQELLNLLIIGSDKYSVPTTMFRSAAAGDPGSEVMAKFEEAIKAYQGGATSYLIFPSQFEPVFPKFEFEPEELVKGIELCNNEIIKESSATFLEMQKGGSYALGSAMIQFFYNAIDAKSKMIAAPFNTRIIPSLVALNRPNDPCMVELMFSAAGQSVSKDYADSLTKLTQQGIITPDGTLESFLRKNMNLPEQDMETIRVQESQEKQGKMDDDDDPEGEDMDDEEEDSKQYSKKKVFSTHKRPPQLMRSARVSVGILIDRIIIRESNLIIDKLGRVFRKAKQDEDKLKTPQLEANRKLITAEIKREFGALYVESRENLKRELSSIEKRRGVKDGFATGASFAKKGKIYTDKDAELMAKTLGEEIEDVLGASYLSLAIDHDSWESLESKLLAASRKIKKKKRIVSGVNHATSEIVNRSRNDSFEEMEDKIESYTYRNDEPVTSLCNYLVNKTMKPRELKTPPFHWGCDGYIVPNLKKWKNNPKIDKIKITGKMKKGMDFLS